MDNLYTTDSAAKYLGVTPSRVRQLITDKRIQSEKYGRDHLIAKEDLVQYKISGKKRAGRKPNN